MMTQRQTRFLILAVFLIPPLLFLFLLLLAVFRGDNADYFARENMVTISAAVAKFQSTHGEPPAGDNAAIFRALEGANTNNAVFVESARTNAAGEILDSWGTPYQIRIGNGAQIVIRSAGKDRVWGDSDDIVYDSAKRDFVTP
jgi:hypothetical protein